MKEELVFQTTISIDELVSLVSERVLEQIGVRVNNVVIEHGTMTPPIEVERADIMKEVFHSLDEAHTYMDKIGAISLNKTDYFHKGTLYYITSNGEGTSYRILDRVGTKYIEGVIEDLQKSIALNE